MGWQSCPSGHRWRTCFQPSPRELFCKECGEGAVPALKAASNRRNALQVAEAPVVADAHLRFTQLVTEWPCWAKENRRGHICWGDIDPHHLVPAGFIRSAFSDLRPDEMAEILYEPVLGAPVCRSFHEALENRSEVIHWHELDDEVKLFCKRIDERFPGHQSMLARLELESPAERRAA